MTVSVALATYNGESFIVPQLDSLLNQTRRPDEVIIIDDRSTDKTPEIVRDYISSHGLDWKLTVAETNSGYKRNFYNCLKNTTGDVVFLCDQDDVWYPEKIEKVLTVFENDRDCLGVNTSFDMTDREGAVLVPFGEGKRNTANHGLILYPVGKGDCVRVDLNTVLVYNISPGCTCAFKREAVECYLQTSRCEMPHDWELNVIAAKQDGLRFLNVPLIGYRQHGNNTIGLSTDNSFGPLKMRGAEDVRFKVLQQQTAQLEMVRVNINADDKEQVVFLQKLQRFCENRKSILYDKKLIPCFKNLFLYHRLKEVATIHFRGLIGDFVYVLKH